MDARGAVLLVEDEALILEMLACEFQEAGFGVIEAGSADAAVAWLAERPQGVAAVVTDLRMPGRLDGLGLAAWMAEHRPEVPVVITSGYAVAPDAAAVNPGVAAVLPKPYLPAEVVALVASLLAGRVEGEATRPA